MVSVWFLVLASYKVGTVVIPQPYLSKEKCIESANEMMADGNAKTAYDSGVTKFAYSCVRAER